MTSSGSAPINLYNTSTTLPDGSLFSETPTLRYYDFVRGPVHFFMLDNCPTTPYGRDQNSIQGQWLKQRLAASTSPWKIVCFHEPPYTSATGGEETEEARWPFQSWGADVVLFGHVHNYERLAMPDPGETSPTIPYIINGAGGFVPECGFETSHVLPGSIVRVDSYGAQLLEADEYSLSLLYYDINNNLRDSLTLFKDNSSGQPTVTFSNPQATFADDASTAELVVQRLGSTDQEITVQYATVSGTAVAGVNFVANSGILTFAPGDTEQTITITLINAPDAPTDLHFSVVLSSPASPAVLGFFASADVSLYNTSNTPINNTTTFVYQTFRDLLHREPTPTELNEAIAYINSSILADTSWRKAEFISDEIFGNNTYLNQEAIFTVARIYHLIQFNLLI